MRELLPDNIALAERLESLHNSSLQAKDPEARDVTVFPTWVSAFETYLEVVTEAHPGRVRDMCTYMHVLTREVQKFGGWGWATYDSVFRKNRQGIEARWDVLDPSVHLAHIMSRSQKPMVACTSCNEVDHSPEDCALVSLQQKVEAVGRSYPYSRDWSSPYPCPGTPLSRLPLRPPTSTFQRICILVEQGGLQVPRSLQLCTQLRLMQRESPSKRLLSDPPDLH